ncbi:MAG: hypothetical protein UX02_C0001G0216 [Candidatus Moranbacteria bacterium GW2011_GWC1_45_18]|nr:MAG: hypothetical protein UT79_C0002G0181 [Candidatus Moranbacteria bacterium GW2011_GWC2_40_12]KKT70711.1 MAG: hypothetical protein UW66_C0038G0002 [Candidatus Moranbacteria bacterium GW2011_GWF1_44_4]KKU00768.1 MAG: hypothetical protein UX02_C0001G0216 [Candidatus Moranbacteria bacterium GW2011_GWC1_45_18]OGI22692.1 MAG: hypothetical protein A2194_03195 [Candidatus Moranbacteria bacterium RIFOXYA1_FULL_44_8]OGI35282.1 MAG: hypothetical protein A2407_02060 [Candidatus Moranbacteria bacteriu
MTKKIFAISTLLLVLVIGAIFAYNFLFKKPASQEEGLDNAKISEEGKLNATDSSGKTAEKNASIQAISDEPVFGATLSPDGNFLYAFLASNGQLNQFDLSGKLEKVLSTEKFEDIKKITWNKPRNKAIIKTEPAPGMAKFLYFDISGKKVSVLKGNIDSVSWSNLGDKIIYKHYDPKTKKRTVNVADPDGKNWHTVAEMSYRSAEMAPIPGSSDISFWPSPNAFTAAFVASVTFGGENQKELFKDRYGVDLLWSPNGDQAALSASDEKGGHKIDLLLMSRQGGEIQSLVFPTFAAKCAWSSDSKTLYCAMPGDIPDSAILPNDWQEGKVTTSDTFWKIDITSGKKERLVDPEKIGSSYDVLNPFLSPDEKSLFFVSKSDGKLHKLSI